MFGIGLPELILILALALIVVGPDKLPDMAKSIAKQLLELKKTANSLKDSLQEELKDEEAKGEESERPWEQLGPLSDEDIASLKESPGFGEMTQVNDPDAKPGDALSEDIVVESEADEGEESVVVVAEGEADDGVKTKN